MISKKLFKLLQIIEKETNFDELRKYYTDNYLYKKLKELENANLIKKRKRFGCKKFTYSLTAKGELLIKTLQKMKGD